MAEVGSWRRKWKEPPSALARRTLIPFLNISGSNATDRPRQSFPNAPSGLNCRNSAHKASAIAKRLVAVHGTFDKIAATERWVPSCQVGKTKPKRDLKALVESLELAGRRAGVGYSAVVMAFTCGLGPPRVALTLKIS